MFLSTLNPKSPTHPLNPTHEISLRFLNSYLEKKVKQKRFKVLVLSPRGSMCWDTNGQGLLPLQPAPKPPPDPWLQKQGGAGASTGPRRAASQDLAEPQAASFNLATVDEHRRKKTKQNKTLSSNRGKTLNSIPVSIYPMILPHLIIRLPGICLNLILKGTAKIKK